MHTLKSRKAYDKAREAFDQAVQNLKPEEYKEVIGDMAAHIQCCEDCLKDENPDLYAD